MKLFFHTPPSGGWTVVKDQDGKLVYEGHSRCSDLIEEILFFAGIQFERIEWESDESFEEEFC